MTGRIVRSAILSTSLVLSIQTVCGAWNPPSNISREEVFKTSQEVLGRPDIKLDIREDIFRIRVLEMDWDIGAMVYEPLDTSKIPVGPDGTRAGVFLLHGGSGDHRSRDTVARLLAGKFGFKVVSMTYPGRLYLLDPSRDWPGDTENPDGTVRTPIWNKDILITDDQYEVREDKSMMERYGSIILACAKEGTEFYHRMAGWPVAFEEGAKDLMRRHLPTGEYSIYIHGHSTGGPFSFMLTQRVPNIVGVMGLENSPFGYIYSRLVDTTWNLPFNCLKIRTWRDTARSAGIEAAEYRDPMEILNHLTMLMEEIYGDWEKGTTLPQFKAEYPIHLNGVESLAAAAQAVGTRLSLTAGERNDLVRQYKGYTRELAGEGVKPVPPVLLSISGTSRDHTLERYNRIILPMFAAMNPAPKTHLVQFGAGVHGYERPEPGLPKGIAPAVFQLFYDALMGGFYEDYARQWAAN